MSTFNADLPDGLWRRWIDHSALLLDSHRRQTGRDLIARGGGREAEAERLLRAPFVVVSHGVEADPLLNYGNRAACALWEMSPATLITIPSRQTAEPMLREARERLLDQVSREGYVTGYEGLRISASGRRFKISGVTIWEVADAAGQPAGQAASFARWTFL